MKWLRVVAVAYLLALPRLASADLLQKSATYTRAFLMVQSADHITGITGATVACNLSKAGAVGAAAGGVISQIDATNLPGWYKVAYTTTDTNTTGNLAAHCTATSADPTDFVDQVIDSTALLFGVNLINIAGAAVSTSTAQLGVNAVNIAGQAAAVDVNNLLKVDAEDWKGTAVVAPATAGIPDTNAKNVNNVATTSVTTVSANLGTTQPVNFTGTGAAALAKVDVTDIAAAAVSTTTAQIGANVVNYGGNAVSASTVGIPDVNMVRLNNGLTSGNNATLSLAGLSVVAAAGNSAITVTGGAASGATPAGHALNLSGGAASTTAGGSAGNALSATGGAGAASTNGAGAALVAAAGGTVTVSGNDALQLTGTGNGNGATLTRAGTGADLKLGGSGTILGGAAIAPVNAVQVNGTTQTARDLGASVLLSPGTGVGQISLTSGAVTIGTNNDKTGYSLTQTFPTNFSALSITAGGAVTAGTVSDKTGYSLTQAFPTNFASLAIDLSGRVDLGKVLGTASAGAVGYVGIDWSKITNPTATVGLSGTTVGTVTTISGVTLTNAQGIKKNAPLNAYTFAMYDGLGMLKGGLAPACQRAIDGGAFATCTNSPVEISGPHGFYSVNLSAADLNGNVIAFYFTAAGANPVAATIVTVSP